MDNVRFYKKRECRTVIPSSYTPYIIYDDIDVDHGIKCVVFKPEDSQSRTEFELSGVKKQFPDVEELVIEDGVYNIRISNFMFPNVKRVTSHNKLYPSGSILVESARLLNTFCKKPGEVIDLRGIRIIEQYALSGCLSTNFIHDEQIKYIESRALDNSLLDILPSEVIMLGHVLVKYDAPVIDLPDRGNRLTSIYAIEDRPQKKITNKIIIHNKDSLRGPFLYGGDGLLDTIKEISIYDDTYIYDPNHALKMRCHRTKMSVQTELYKTIGGIIYTANLKKLVACADSDLETVVIPEGVETICEQAFKKTSVKSVKLPDSLKQIQNEAFASTPISSVTFGNQLQLIAAKAFYECSQLREVHLPSSLTCVGENAFSNLDKVYSDNLPDGLFNALIHPESEWFQQVIKTEATKKTSCMIELHLKRSTMFLPKFVSLSVKQITELELKVSIKGNYDFNLLYANIKDTSLKQETALQLYNKTKDDTLRIYLRRAGIKIASDYIATNKEEQLICFLKLGLLTTNALNKLLSKVQTKNMASAAAYILTQLKNSKKGTSFRL